MSVLFAAAQSSAVDAYALTTGRVVGSVAALLGLAGLLVGARALVRARRGAGSGGAVVALVTGLAGTVAGGIVVAVADGGPGTGAGIVGGYVALVVGGGAVAVSALALTRRSAARH